MRSRCGCRLRAASKRLPSNGCRTVWPPRWTCTASARLRERRDARLDQRKWEVHRLQLKKAALRRLIAGEEGPRLNVRKNEVTLAAAQALLAAQWREELHGATDGGLGRIMSMTGVGSVEELVESFIHWGEKAGPFQAMLDALRARVGEL